MKVYALIRLSNDLYVENVLLAICKTKESAIKLSALCNEYEIKELLIRKALEEWVIDTPEARQNLQQYLASLEFKEDD